MRTHKWFLLALLLGSCSGSSQQVEQSPEPQSDPEPPTAKPGRMKANVVTVGDMANALGVPVEFAIIANEACYHRVVTCKEDLHVDYLWCEPVLAREWCRANNCSPGGESDGEAAVACRKEITARGCTNLDKPLECPYVQEAGYTIVPDAWPEGPVANPFPGILPDN